MEFILHIGKMDYQGGMVNIMKILLIGPYAPLGHVGAIRIISLSKYLLQKGHSVSVLCLSQKSLKKIDPKGLCSIEPEGIDIINYDITFTEKSLMKRNYKNINETNRALEKLLSHKNYDVAIVSGGPFYTFPAMKIINNKKIPYIVDYRDLHISSPEKRKKTGFVNKLKFLISYPFRYYQEYDCIKNSHFVTVVHPDMIFNLSHYFRLPSEKIKVVYNGFDDMELEGISPVKPKNDNYTIGYFGKLMYYNTEYTKKIFKAIDDLNEEGYKIRFIHIGQENKLIEQYFSKENINKKKWYKCLGLMNYRDGMAILGSCKAFALEYTMSEGPGTKIFDYIYWNKPVVAVTKNGIALEKMLREFENAYICHTTEDVKNSIKYIIDKNVNSLTSTDNSQNIQFYARSKQNSEMEKLIMSAGAYYDEFKC